MSPSSSTRVFLVVILLCLSALGGSGVVVADTTDNAVFQQSSPDSPDSDDESDDPRHQHPDEAEEEGNLDAVRQYLASQLSGSLEQGSVEISEGEYDQARETVGDDYNETLSRYVEVAEESDSESDQEAAHEYEEAAENQRKFADSAEQYEETYDEYQEARAAGDDERARELARELERLSEDTDESATALEENYENLSDSTNQDFNDEQQAVEGKQEEINSTQGEIQALEFVETELTIDSATETISFTDPLVIEGQLETEDGTPIADEEVTFEIGEQMVTTTTDSDGAFTLTYHPTVLPTDTESLEITYEPDSGSEYADATATVPVAVEQAEPEVTIESDPETVAFGDEMTVTGTVTGESGGEDEGAAGVPVTVSMGEERLGEVTTNSDGTFELTTTAPGTVPAGEAELHAELPLEEQALTSATTTDSITVEETETQVSVSTAETDDGQIAVSGRLATADDRAITNQPIRILVDGTVAETVQTDETGEYEATVDSPAVTDGSAEVTAVYDGAGTNLADAESSDTISGLPIASSVRDLLWWPGVFLTVLGFVLILWVYRSRKNEHSSDELPYAIGPQSGDTESSEPTASRVPPETLLELARDCKQNGESNRAIALAYAAVRTHFATGAVPGWTHWEFYNETESQLDESQRETLLSITERFEQAMFAPVSIPDSVAGAVITAAATLIEGSQSTTKASTAD